MSVTGVHVVCHRYVYRRCVAAVVAGGCAGMGWLSRHRGCVSWCRRCVVGRDVVSLWGRIYTGLKIVSLSHQVQSYTPVPIIGGVQMIVTVRAGGPTPHVCATVGPYASLVPRNHRVGP